MTSQNDMADEMKLDPGNPVLKEAIQSMVGDVTLIRGSLNNFKFSSGLTAVGTAWKFNSNGTWILVGPGGGTTFLRDDGTFATIGAASLPPETVATCNFDKAERYGRNVGATGVNTFDGNGVTINAASDFANVDWTFCPGGGSGSGYSNNPQFSVEMSLGVALTDNNAIAFVGIGAPTTDATQILMTDAHVGWKIQRVAGATNLYATQSDGTETASGILTTVANGDSLELVCKITSGTSAAYYWSKNHSALSSATTLSTHLPSSASNSTNMRFAASAASTATQTKIIVTGASYRRY